MSALAAALSGGAVVFAAAFAAMWRVGRRRAFRAEPEPLTTRERLP